MKSLRGRLTLGMTLVLAVVVTLAGGLASSYVDDSERESLDNRLRSIAELSRETALATVENSIPDNDRRLDDLLSASQTSIRLLVGDQQLLDYGRPPPFRGTRPANGLRTITLDGRRYRSYVVPVRNADQGGNVRLEVTARLDPLERRQRDLNQRLALFGIGAVLLAALGVFLAADVILRPLRRLRAATSRFAGTEDLDRRVPTDDGPAELRELATDFNAMIARLGDSAEDRERALQATRRFTADAGHELRTPLTTVQATLSALSRHPDIAPERRAELLGHALTEHHRLVDLLDGLQALARGDSARVEMAELDLADLVAVAVDDARARHPETTFEAEAPGPRPVRGWEPGLRSLLDNLLENAARHGRPGGLVRVGLAGTELVVDDDGPGVPEAEREAIFAPFRRAIGTTAPGSGLGLALVAQQARIHGAEVLVGDSPLGGARFTVRLSRGSASPSR